MNLDELRTVRRNERETDSLQHLRESFYRDAADYIASLKAERERAADRADDPFASPEVRRLTDEIETAEEVVEAVYERRVGKVVKRASFAAADMATEDEGLTEEERELFDDLVGRIRENRERVLATIAEGAVDGRDAAPAQSGDDEAAAGDGHERAVPPEDPSNDDNLLADAMGGSDATPAASPEAAPAGATADEPGSNPPDDTGSDDPSRDDPPEDDPPRDDRRGDGVGPERTTVRITRDVGSILCVDEREYDLESEDVVTLPAPNATPLLERDAAERVD